MSALPAWSDGTRSSKVCWLREERKEKEGITRRIGKATKEETSKKTARKEERGENGTVSAKRCVGSVSVDAFDIC